MGSVWKRCTHDGRTRNTGLPARGKRPAVPACRCDRGSWYWRTDLPTTPDGERRQQSGREATKALAAEALVEAEARIAAGVLTDDRGLTVEAWLTQWLAAGKWKPKARASYASDVRVYLVPHLGAIRLKDLRRRDVRAMVTAMAEAGASGHVCAKAIRTLSAALSIAVADERIAVNVADGRIPEIPRRDRTSGTILEVKQVRAFLDFVASWPCPVWGVDPSLWVVDAYTGLRRGELLGVPWTAVSLTGDTPDDYPGIIVEQTVVELPGHQHCPVCAAGHRGRFLQRTTREHLAAKSRASTGRWVPLTAEGVDALIAHRERQREHRERLGDLYVDHGLIWADPTGGPLRPDAVTKAFKLAIAAAGLPSLTPKGLRRGAASMLAATGMPLELVAIVLGQADPQVTRDHYLRGLRSTLAEGVDDVARLVRGDDARRTG